MKLKLLTLASAAVVDQLTQNISITSIIQQLQAPIFPISISSLTLVAFFTKTKSEPNDPKLNFVMKLDSERIIDHEICYFISRKTGDKARRTNGADPCTGSRNVKR